MGHLAAFFNTTLPVALVTTALRFLVNRIFCGARLGQRTPKHPRSTLVEESWLLGSATLLLALSTWAVQKHNERCTLFDQTACFEGWPRTHNSTVAAHAFAAFLGWYLHGILKSFVPGVGLRSGRDMLSHHLLTLLLFGAAHIFNTQRMGLLILSMFNFSNPFMHVAKVLHGANAAKPAKAGAFMVFAAAFAISRCIAFPNLLWAILRELSVTLRAGDRRPLVPAVFCIGGLFALLLLQFYWLARILRVIKNGGLEHAHNKASQGAQASSSVSARPQRRSCELAQPATGQDSPQNASDESSCTTDPLEATASADLGLRSDSKVAELTSLRQRHYYDSARGEARLASQSQAAH